jgi:hypothetical protein
MAHINPTPNSEPEPGRRFSLDSLRALTSYHIAMKITNMNGLPMILIGMAACIGSVTALYSIAERPFVHVRDHLIHSRQKSRIFVVPKRNLFELRHMVLTFILATPAWVALILGYYHHK